MAGIEAVVGQHRALHQSGGDRRLGVRRVPASTAPVRRSRGHARRRRRPPRVPARRRSARARPGRRSASAGRRRGPAPATRAWSAPRASPAARPPRRGARGGAGSPSKTPTAIVSASPAPGGVAIVLTRIGGPGRYPAGPLGCALPQSACAAGAGTGVHYHPAQPAQATTRQDDPALMPNTVILGAARTPIGKMGGGLATLRRHRARRSGDLGGARASRGRARAGRPRGRSVRCCRPARDRSPRARPRSRRASPRRSPRRRSTRSARPGCGRACCSTRRSAPASSRSASAAAWSRCPRPPT